MKPTLSLTLIHSLPHTDTHTPSPGDASPSLAPTTLCLPSPAKPTHSTKPTLSLTPIHSLPHTDTYTPSRRRCFAFLRRRFAFHHHRCLSLPSLIQPQLTLRLPFADSTPNCRPFAFPSPIQLPTGDHSPSLR